MRFRNFPIAPYTLSCIVPLLLVACGDSIHDLCAYGELDAVRRIVENDPTALDKPNELGKTPLFFSVTYARDNVTQSLIERGADANARDDTGLTPLHVAALMNHIAGAELLLNVGAGLDARDNFGDTPLHVAAYRNRAKIIPWLIQRGADSNARNNEGLRPIDLAMTHRCDAAAAELRKFDLGSQQQDEASEVAAYSSFSSSSLRPRNTIVAPMRASIAHKARIPSVSIVGAAGGKSPAESIGG